MCKANGLEIVDEDNIDELRRKLRQYVKAKIDSGSTDEVKTLADVTRDEKQDEIGRTTLENANQRVVTISKIEISANLDFDIHKNDWEKFIDRMEQYFIANDIINMEKKRAILLSKVNAETYDMIDKICKPKKPGEKSYEEIVKLVKGYLKPPASYLVHRNAFRQRMQHDNESISEYVTALQELTNDCQFNDADDQVLDQLISGLRSKSIKAELLKIKTPRLDVALKKALGSEAAESGAEKLQKGGSQQQAQNEVHKMDTLQGNPKQQGGIRASGQVDETGNHRFQTREDGGRQLHRTALDRHSVLSSDRRRGH